MPGQPVSAVMSSWLSPNSAASGEIYLGLVLDLSLIDLEDIATARADQNDYEYTWLINPDTGEIVFWTADTGIDGQTPVDLDELDLVVIDPLRPGSGTRTWPTSLTESPIKTPSAGWPALSRAREPSGASKTSSMRIVVIFLELTVAGGRGRGRGWRGRRRRPLRGEGRRAAGSGSVSHDGDDDLDRAAWCRSVDVVRDSGLAVGAGPVEVCVVDGFEESDGEHFDGCLRADVDDRRRSFGGSGLAHVRPARQRVRGCGECGSPCWCRGGGGAGGQRERRREGGCHPSPAAAG